LPENGTLPGLIRSCLGLGRGSRGRRDIKKMRGTKGFEDLEHFEGGKLRKMEEMDLSGHQCGILKLACGTVIALVERVFGVSIVDCKSEEQKYEQEGYIVLFSVQLSHRIP